MRTRRHHNNYGAHTIRSGKTADQVQRIAAKLNVPTGPSRRIDAHGTVKIMAMADGYVMVRRPGAIPFVMTAKEWNSLQPAMAE